MSEDDAGHLGPVPRPARPYQGHRAGVVTRFLASAVDFAVVVAVVALLYGGWAVLAFLWNPAGFTFPSAPRGTLLLAGAVVLVLYLTTGWATTGRTYGDHLLGLRVVTGRGEPLPVVTSALRALVCTVFPVGLLWCAVNRSNRSVADVLLRTSVVYDWVDRTR